MLRKWKHVFDILGTLVQTRAQFLSMVVHVSNQETTTESNCVPNNHDAILFYANTHILTEWSVGFVWKS